MILGGKTALVTGAGAGLGRGIALAYAKYGAQVVVSDIDDDAGRETVGLIERGDGRARYVHADVTSPDECRHMVAAAVSFGGRLDIACNNAGVAPPSTPLADTTDDEWRRVLGVDLDAVFYCARAEIQAMLRTGGGVIVNMASILGQVGFQGLAPYVAAKHGVVGLTKQIALEYAASGVRAWSIGPAFMKTGLEAALDESRGADRSTLILIDTHPLVATQAGGHWWDVAVPEVSVREQVNTARKAYETALAGQRVGD